MLHLLYLTLLFTHVMAAIALCVLDGIGHFALLDLRAASTPEAARLAFTRHALAVRLIAPVPPLLLVSGVILCALSWGFHAAWVDFSLAGFLAVAVLVRAVEFPRLMRLQVLLDGHGPFADVSAAIHDQSLHRAVRARHALIVWLVFLMAVKPVALVAVAALLPALVWTLWRSRSASRALISPEWS